MYVEYIPSDISNFRVITEPSGIAEDKDTLCTEVNVCETLITPAFTEGVLIVTYPEFAPMAVQVTVEMPELT